MVHTQQAISQTIFLTNHLTSAKAQSSRPITWLVLVNQI